MKTRTVEKSCTSNTNWKGYSRDRRTFIALVVAKDKETTRSMLDSYLQFPPSGTPISELVWVDKSTYYEEKYQGYTSYHNDLSPRNPDTKTKAEDILVYQLSRLTMEEGVFSYPDWLEVILKDINGCVNEDGLPGQWENSNVKIKLWYFPSSAVWGKFNISQYRHTYKAKVKDIDFEAMRKEVLAHEASAYYQWRNWASKIGFQGPITGRDMNIVYASIATAKRELRYHLPQYKHTEMRGTLQLDARRYQWLADHPSIYPAPCDSIVTEDGFVSIEDGRFRGSLMAFDLYYNKFIKSLPSNQILQLYNYTPIEWTGFA